MGCDLGKLTVLIFNKLLCRRTGRCSKIATVQIRKSLEAMDTFILEPEIR